MTTVIAFGLRIFKAVPWWVWVILFVAGVFLVREWRTKSLIHELREEIRASQSKAIDDAQKAARQDIQGLVKQVAPLQQSVTALAKQAAESRARQVKLSETLATQDKDRIDLIKSGTVDDVVRAGRALGYNPIPAVRP